jgi:hypothetical protein
MTNRELVNTRPAFRLAPSRRAPCVEDFTWQRDRQVLPASSITALLSGSGVGIFDRVSLAR